MLLKLFLDFEARRTKEEFTWRTSPLKYPGRTEKLDEVGWSLHVNDAIAGAQTTKSIFPR